MYNYAEGSCISSGGRQGEGHAQSDDSERLISLQFSWGTEKKEVSSVFIGTSPEFELALYTLCFVGGAEENIVTIAGYAVKIRCALLRPSTCPTPPVAPAGFLVINL